MDFRKASYELTFFDTSLENAFSEEARNKTL
jgi:hypothetical protein